MRTPTRHRSVARVTLQLTAPLSIGTGQGGDFEDDLFVTDANGLPTLPGTSLAGALRAAAVRVHGAARAEAWFGFIRPGGGDDAQRSAVVVSWGALHDAHDRPVPPLGAPADDPVLANARAGLTRHHVRLDVYGVADDRGKFDRTSVATGHRFTFELELWTDDPPGQGEDLTDLLALLPQVRLGGHTRSGLGTFEIVRVQRARLDLARPEDRRAYAERPLSLAETWAALKPLTLPRHDARERHHITLTPDEPWVIGMTPDLDPDGWIPEGPREAPRPPDLVPYRETRVHWSASPQSQGTIEAGYVVPGSALKGALRHRVAFALRALEGHFAHLEGQSVSADQPGAFAPPDPPALELLFGKIHGQRATPGAEGDGERGAPGRLLVSEGLVRGKPKRRTAMHVSLDRFTGAPMRGLLFEDEALEGGSVVFTLELRPPPDAATDPLWTLARRALDQVLEDMEGGNFQLGAGYGRGYGWFTGQVTRPTEAPK